MRKYTLRIGQVQIQCFPFEKGGEFTDFYWRSTVDRNFGTNLADIYLAISRAGSAHYNEGSTSGSDSVEVPITITESGNLLCLLKLNVIKYAVGSGYQSSNGTCTASASTNVIIKNQNGNVILNETASVSTTSSQTSQTNSTIDCLTYPGVKGSTKFTIDITTNAYNRKYKDYNCSAGARVNSIDATYLVIPN